MPVLPIIRSSNAPSGSVPIARTPDGIDLMPLARGAQAVSNTFAELRDAQERMALRQQEDEARSYVGNTLSRARADTVEWMAEAQQTAPANGAGLTAGLLKRWDGYATEATKNAPEMARPHLQERLSEIRASMHASAFGVETKLREGAMVDDFSAGLDADRKTVFADPRQFGPALAGRTALLNSLTLPAATKAKLLDSTRESLALEAGSAIVERNPDEFLKRAGVAGQKTGKDGKPLPSDPEAAARAVNSDPLLSAMAPTALRQLVDRATMIKVTREAQAAAERERQARLAEIAASKRSREADQAWNILSTWARDGKAANPQQNAALFTAIQGTPYAAAYKELAAQIPARTAAAMLPIKDQQAQLDSLRAQRVAGGTSAGLEDEIKRREQILAGAQKEYADEPFRAAAERGVLPAVAPLDVSTFDTMLATLPGRVEQAKVLQGQVGRAVAPLLSEEVGKVGDMLAALPVAERSRRIAQLSSVMTAGQAQAMAARLSAKDRALSLEFAAGASLTTNGRFTAELIARGSQALKDKAIKEDTAAMIGLRSQLAAEVGDSLSGKARDDVIEAARYIHLGKQAAGESLSIKGAVRLALGGDLVEHNGRRVPVPPGVDAGGLQQRLQTYPVTEIAKQAPDGFVYLPGGRPMGVPEFLGALPAAQLEPAGMGRYVVRSGGSLVLNKAREPITIEVR